MSNTAAAIFTATVTDLSSEGWGVVRTSEGEVVFVPGGWPGDEIKFSVISRGKFALGALEEIVAATDAHRANPCPSHIPNEAACAACPWVGISYSAQLAAKDAKIAKVLAKFKLEPKVRAAIVPSPNEFGYRNRVKLHSDGTRVGYKTPLSQNLAEVSRCLVVEEWINDEIAKHRANPPPAGEFWIQRGSAGEFAQANEAQNQQIKNALAKALESSPGLEKRFNTVELFCGSGNFTEVLANSGSRLACFEGSAEAIAAVKARVPSARAQVLDLYARGTISKISSENAGTTLLFLDPPRSGYRDLGALVQKLPNLTTLIYLSCNPVTFCRDVATLRGWEFRQLLPFDMFPQTPHIEVMGFFARSAQ